MKRFSSKTKTHFRRRSTSGERIRRGLVLLVVVLVLSVIFSRIFGMVAAYVASPFGTFSSFIANVTAPIPAFFKERATLQSNIDELTRELEATRLSQGSVRALEEENAELRALLRAEDDERIAAGVLRRPVDTPYDTLFIDRGSSDGILVGAPVFATKDHIIGSISAVYETSALVTLTTAPGHVSTAYIYGPDIYTEALGQGGGVLRVSVPQGVGIAVGDVVVLPSVYPGVFGTITHITAHESSPEQYGYVTNEIPQSALRVVAVGTRSLEPSSFEAVRENVERMYEDLFVVPVPADILVSTSSATSSATTTAISTEQQGE